MSVLSLSRLGCIVVATSGHWLLPDRRRDAWLSGLTLALSDHACAALRCRSGRLCARHPSSHSSRMNPLHPQDKEVEKTHNAHLRACAPGIKTARASASSTVPKPSLRNNHMP